MVPLLGGCSFIYNPDHINRDIDAHMVDVETVVDVNPAGLMLTDVFPKTVYEGVGTGGARKAVVVIRGEEIAATATVTIKPATGADSQIMVDPPVIAADHRWIAATITVPVDEMQDETGMHAAGSLALVITVDNGMGFTAAMPDKLTVTWLDQLKAPMTAPPDPALKKRYSIVDVMAAQHFTPDAAAHRVELRSMSSINFHTGITVDAAADAPGPGGCPGGPIDGTAPGTTVDGATCQSGHTGASGSSKGGGGGGYVLAGDASSGAVPGGDPTGEPQIKSFMTNVAGGGGGGNTLLLGLGGLTGGGVGGGGGGTILLEAAGDLTVTKNGAISISASGAMGAAGGLGGGGGGGAGGTVVLRAGGTMVVDGTIVVSGNTGAGTAGGAHGGRVRYEAATPPSIPSAYQAAMFLTVPPISTVQLIQDQSVVLVGTAGEMGYTGIVYGKDDSTLPDGDFSVGFGGNSKATPNIMLTPGYNKICVAFVGGNVLQNPLQGTCAEMAYLP